MLQESSRFSQFLTLRARILLKRLSRPGIGPELTWKNRSVEKDSNIINLNVSLLGKLWFNLSLRMKALCVVAVPVITLVVALGVFMTSESRQQEAETWWLSHTFEVRKEIRHTLSELLDAEMGVHDYLATGRKEYLHIYEQCQLDLPRHLARLRTFAREDLGQGHRISELEPSLYRTLAGLGALTRTPASAAHGQE